MLHVEEQLIKEILKGLLTCFQFTREIIKLSWPKICYVNFSLSLGTFYEFKYLIFLLQIDSNQILFGNKNA